MATCSHCGAPLVFSSTSTADCSFCGVTNAPADPQKAAPQPVMLVQRVVQVTPGAETTQDLDRCPHCRRAFGSVTVGDVELNGCPGCGGIWLDNASAQKVLADPQDVFNHLATRAANNAKAKRPRNPMPTCPTCGAVLDRSWFQDVELDVCAEHGTWFDALELGFLVTSLREAKRVKERDQSGGSVTCAVCRAVVQRARTNITSDGTICDDCYAAGQRKAAAAVAPGTDKPAGSVLLALHKALYAT